MTLCPLCNAFETLEVYCSKCGHLLRDAGKAVDFSDPYSHYNDEETIKLSDGYPNTARDHICPHVMSCQNCGHDEVHFVREQ